MIVAFSGAHSCGKSTLVEFFRGKEGYVCIDSCTRSTISAEERKVDGVTDLGSAQIKMLDNVTKRMADIVKMNVEDPTKIYMMDRSIYDFRSYSKAFLKKELLSQEIYSRIERETEKFNNSFDIVFYLKPEFNIVDDGVRSLDDNLRKDVDTEIRAQLFWNKVRVVELTGTVDQRINTIRDSLLKLR